MFGLDDIGGLISGGGAIADLLGGSSDADKQLKLAKKQYKLMKKLALAGQNSGRGLRVYWNPDAGPTGEGEWVTEYSGQAQLEQDASFQNLLNRLMQDEPRQLGARQDNWRQRQEMRPIIDQLIGRLGRTTDISPGALESDLNTVSSGAINDVYDKARGAMARQAMRTPGANVQTTAGPGKFISANAKDLASARAENRLKALTGAEDINSGRRGNLINQINSLSGNAFNYDDVPFQPSQLQNIGLNIGANKPGQASNLLAYGLQGMQNAPSGTSQYGAIGATTQGILENLNNMFDTSGDPVGPANPMGLGGKTKSQHTAYLRNHNLDRAF